jgi:hypothetical protein
LLPKSDPKSEVLPKWLPKIDALNPTFPRRPHYRRHPPSTPFTAGTTPHHLSPPAHTILAGALLSDEEPPTSSATALVRRRRVHLQPLFAGDEFSSDYIFLTRVFFSNPRTLKVYLFLLLEHKIVKNVGIIVFDREEFYK